MDLGRFERSRLLFWSWLIVPVALVLVTVAPSMLYLRRQREGLAQRQALLAKIPDLEALTKSVDALLRSATPMADQGAQAAEEATRRLDQAAKNAGLVIRSMKVEDGTVPVEGFHTVRITVQVQGALRSVVQWLHETQKPGLLLSVQGAGLTALSLPPDEAFAGELVLVLYLRKS